MNINNEQRKALAEIVESNGNYEKFYANRYAAGETAIIAKANKFLGEYLKVEEAITTLKEEHRAENIKRENLQDKEVKKLSEKRDAIEKQISKIGGRIAVATKYSDYSTHIEAVDTGARHDYDMWRKLVISKIWGAESLEDAKKAVEEFWTA